MKLINAVKALVLAAPLVFALSAQAAGQEELCSQVAESDVRMKVLMTKDERFFEETLHNSTPFVLAASVFSPGEFPVASGTGFCPPTSV